MPPSDQWSAITRATVSFGAGRRGLAAADGDGVRDDRQRRAYVQPTPRAGNRRAPTDVRRRCRRAPHAPRRCPPTTTRSSRRCSPTPCRTGRATPRRSPGTRSPARRGRRRRSTAPGQLHRSLRRLVHRVPAGLAAAGRGRGDPRRARHDLRRRRRGAAVPARGAVRDPAARDRAERARRAAAARAGRSLSRRDGACRLARGGRDLPPGAARRRRRDRRRRGARRPRRLVRDASYDSRATSRRAALFFCIPGDVVGRARLRRSRRSTRAPRALVVERPLAVAAPQVRRPLGPRGDRSDGRRAVRAPGRRRLTLVGVTGTNGKTTITYLLEAVFRAAGWTARRDRHDRPRIDGEPAPLAHTTPEAPDLHRAPGPDACRRACARSRWRSRRTRSRSTGSTGSWSTSRCSRTCPRTIWTSTVDGGVLRGEGAVVHPGARPPRGRQRRRSLGAPAARGRPRSPSRVRCGRRRRPAAPTWSWCAATGSRFDGRRGGGAKRPSRAGSTSRTASGCCAAGPALGVPTLDAVARAIADRALGARADGARGGRAGVRGGSGLRTHAG